MKKGKNGGKNGGDGNGPLLFDYTFRCENAAQNAVCSVLRSAITNDCE